MYREQNKYLLASFLCKKLKVLLTLLVRFKIVFITESHPNDALSLRKPQRY